MKRQALLAAVVATFTAVAVLAADESKKPVTPASKPATTQALIPYPLKTCIVSGEPFGGDMGDPIVTSYNGREIKFCCKSCVKKFNKDPEKYLKQMDEQVKAPKKDA